MSHELRTPLTTAMGYAQLLVGKVEDKQLRQVALRIFYETQRATDTVRNLLAFVEQPRPNTHPENLNDIITKALERKAYDLRLSNIEVEAALSPGLPTILLDAPQLHQVFLHILTNACQAMADYGTTRKLRIQTSQCGQHLHVEIADTGPGIAPEHLQHVFTPFFTTKSQGKGMELGLSIARDIIRAHHGTVAVQSRGGEGTTVVIELPLVAA